MSPTLEEALDKFKSNEIEAGQQILIKILNDDPGDDAAWKHLIESYPDLDFQLRLANEYFNLTAGSPKATQALLRYTRIKTDRYVKLEVEDQKWLDKLKWLEKIKWFGKVKWSKPLLFKVIAGLLVSILLLFIFWIGSSISASVRTNKLQADFDRLSGVYSQQLLDSSKFNAQYTQLETRYTDLEARYIQLQAAYDKLLVDYQAHIEGTTPP